MKHTLSVLFTLIALMIPMCGNAQKSDTLPPAPKSRLTIGGYGEAVYSYHFYSDNAFRYSHASNYTESKGHGQVDLPHAVILLNYDFGHGWTFNTEIEFEHGGTESAIEIEDEETGEYEKEIERGGEVALEQFWLQKSWGKGLNLRMGHDIVPVGGLNNAHLPNEFFNVYRPEGENTILPCTWHATGASLWGRLGDWRYQGMVLASLNSSMFDKTGWIHDGSASAYEYTVANHLGFAGRIDNYTIKGLRMSISGFIGNTFNNDIVVDENSSKYKDVKGLLMVGSFDFCYKGERTTVRGNFDYGHLNDAAKISAYNVGLSNSTQAPYPHSFVGEEACAAGIEAGYNWLRSNTGKKLYTFARYDYYDSYIPVENMTDYQWTDRNVVSAGINYCPIPEITVKAEAGIRLLKEQYNNEPWVAMGITWAGMFNRR